MPLLVLPCPGIRRGLLTFKRRSYLSRNFGDKNLSKWKSVVGLEVHAQIQSNSKLFSGAGTNFQTAVNCGVSLFDAAFPGTLPVLNKKCVEAGALTALALSCELNPVSHFNRKHYFYADLPAGYQITQYHSPLARNGCITFVVHSESPHPRLYKKTSSVHQIQLEQDSGRSLHDDNRSLVDLNRAGIPLMELVFKPDLSDGEEAAALVKELCLILTRLGTCSCKMEEGALRVDANVSIHREGSPLGTRTEIKNISSTRAVANAIDYEINRQISCARNGELIVNETRFWDAMNSETVPMRDKEENQDYRYMPEPNLPPLHLKLQDKDPVSHDIVDVTLLHKLIPELPEATRERFQKDYGISLKHAHMLVNHEILYSLFNDVIKLKNNRNGTILSNLLLNDVLEILNEDICVKFSPIHIGEIVDGLEEEYISKSIARTLLRTLITETEMSPLQIIKKKNLRLISAPSEIDKLCRTVMAQNEDMVLKHVSGKKNFVKQLEKKVWTNSGGLANMKRVKEWFSLNLPFDGKKEN